MRRLRKRRAAGLIPVGGEGPGDRDVRLLPAVETTIAAPGLGERDAAVAQLARVTAGLIDRAENPALALRTLGPLLLRVLVALEATPAARPPQRPAPGRPTRLDAMRAARAHVRPGA
jgi:hypothetical protein